MTARINCLHSVACVVNYLFCGNSLDIEPADCLVLKILRILHLENNILAMRLVIYLFVLKMCAPFSFKLSVSTLSRSSNFVSSNMENTSLPKVWEFFVDNSEQGINSYQTQYNISYI